MQIIYIILIYKFRRFLNIIHNNVIMIFEVVSYIHVYYLYDKIIMHELSPHIPIEKEHEHNRVSILFTVRFGALPTTPTR